MKLSFLQLTIVKWAAYNSLQQWNKLSLDLLFVISLFPGDLNRRRNRWIWLEMLSVGRSKTDERKKSKTQLKVPRSEQVSQQLFEYIEKDILTG